MTEDRRRGELRDHVGVDFKVAQLDQLHPQLVGKRLERLLLTQQPHLDQHAVDATARGLRLGITPLVLADQPALLQY